MSALRVKAMCVGPSLAASTLVVTMVVGPAPMLMQLVVGWGGLLVTALLLAGRGEALGVRLLAGGRELNTIEREAMGDVMARVAGARVGTADLELYAARRAYAPAAIARGRHSIVVARELVHGVATGALEVDEAAAVICHAAAVSGGGRSRQDLAILFWTWPWRSVRLVLAPFRGVAKFARFGAVVVVPVAVWQSLSAAPQPIGMIAAAVIIALVAVVALSGRWAHAWERFVVAEADQVVVDLGMGEAMARFLRRYPRTLEVVGRLQVLERPRAGLRLVS